MSVRHLTVPEPARVRIPGWSQPDHANRYVVFLGSWCKRCEEFKQSGQVDDWRHRHNAIIYEYETKENLPTPPPTIDIRHVTYIPMVVFFDKDGRAHRVSIKQ